MTLAETLHWIQVKFKLKISQLIDVVSFLEDRRKKRNGKLNSTFGFEVKRPSTVKYAKQLGYGGRGGGLENENRETREGWPLLTVETEVNGGDAKSTNERCSPLVSSLGLSCRYKSFLICLGCSCRPSTKYFFLNVHYFNSLVPITQQAGEAVVLGRLSLCMCL